MKIKTLTLLTTLAGLATSHAALSLQIDFGNDGAYVGTLAPAGISDTVWNQNNNTDVFSGLLYGDGTAATGVSLEVGAAPTAGNAINFTTDDARNTAGNTDTQGGIYDTSLTDSWIFDSSNADLGVRVTGLEAGTYDVYALVREPNVLNRTYNVGIGAFTAADSNTIASGSSQLTTTAITDATGASTTSFTEGLNFAVTRVTITDSSDFIGLVIDPTNERFATISALQIVAVPEPSSTALLGLGALGFIVRRRR